MTMHHHSSLHLLLHPELFTDEQLRQHLASDPAAAALLRHLPYAKQALMLQELEAEAAPVDDEWRKFYAEHSQQVDALAAPQRRPFRLRLLRTSLPRHAAACIIGAVLSAGVAFAAVGIVRFAHSHQQPQGQVEPSSRTGVKQSLPTDTLLSDSLATPEAIVFDNAPLGKMLPQIAAYYNLSVRFRTTDANALRFYFVWRPEEGLEQTLGRLRLFQRVTITLKDNTLVVE